MALLETRRADLFPVLGAFQVEAARRFSSGPPKTFAAGALLYGVGEPSPTAWLVLEGSIEILRRDALGHSSVLTALQPGQFTGELRHLTGRPTIAAARAGAQGCTAVPFDPPHLRALLIGSAEIGEIVMRAFVLRREGLLEEKDLGAVLVGPVATPEFVRLADFLEGNNYPYSVLDTSSGGEGRSLVERMGVAESELPLLLCPDGSVMKRPTETEAGVCLGITPDLDPAAVHDVVIVGAGPAGLAAAVYAASEGLSVLVLDRRSVGGQAGASARIENYLGFPEGISGRALAGRAFSQAAKFGAIVAVPLDVVRLVPRMGEAREGPIGLELGDGRVVRGRTVVVASGAAYRKPDIPELSTFEGSGVSYWASPVELALVRDRDVVVVGGGNSAGQAAVYLAESAKHVHVLVRGEGLAESMSRYLIRRIEEHPRTTLRTRTELVGLGGGGHLEQVRWRSSATGEVVSRPMRHVFMMTGAEPNTAWLADCIALDEKRFVKTGTELSAHDLADAEWPLARAPYLLETSVPGIFAVGDVRAGNVKRVASAVGEGSISVHLVHKALAG